MRRRRAWRCNDEISYSGVSDEEKDTPLFFLNTKMFIERPPYPYRMLFPEAIWRMPQVRKTVYLTFDDGPVPQVTPWVLEVLARYGVRATFFVSAIMWRAIRDCSTCCVPMVIRWETTR